MRIMAKKPATSESTNSETPSTAKTMESKLVAFQEAIEALGAEAKPLALQEWIEQRYGVTLKTSLLSTYKSTWLRQQETNGGSRPAAVRPRRTTPNVGAGAPNHPTLTLSGLTAGNASPAHNADRDRDATLRDIRVLREMLNRVGESQLREMLDLLGVR
jgi:hypothetical protein